MPFAIMYPFRDRGPVGGPRLPLHTEQPLLSHKDSFAEDLRVLPQEGGLVREEGVSSLPFSGGCVPPAPFPPGPSLSPLPSPWWGTQVSSVPVVGEPVDEGSADRW